MTSLRAVIAVCVLACLAALAVLYYPHLPADDVVPEVHTTPTAQTDADVARVQRHVDSVLQAPILRNLEPLFDEEEERSDQFGTWTARNRGWLVPENRYPSAVSRRIEMLLTENHPEQIVYVTQTAALHFEVRIYAGSRLASTLLLKPTLERWPKLSSDREPLLSVVLVLAPGQARSTRDWLEQSHPFALALPAFDAFSLRLAHDAVIQRKEVLVTIDGDDDAKASLNAIPHITGAVIIEHPAGIPGQFSTNLADRDLLVLDPDGRRLPTSWRTTLREAKIPIVTAELIAEPSDVDEMLTRHHHRAQQNGASVLLAMATDEIAPTVLADLAEAASRGYRPAFLPEVMHRLESGLAP